MSGLRFTTMSVVSTAVAALVLLLNVQLGRSCDKEGQSLICHSIPSYFSPGCLTLLMYVKGVGNINSTVFRSESLASVARLRMDGAGITGIAEGAFTSLQNLTSVSLTGNFLTQINSNWFGRPAVLSELSLSENQIEAVSESTLSRFIGLTKLSLKRNRIRTIGPNSFGSLAELDLSENSMTRLSPQVFGSLRPVRIRLDGNPWDCSCAAQDFVFFLKGLQTRSQLDRESQVTCASPSGLRGRRVWNVTVCVTSPEPESTSVSQSASVRPTEKVETTPSRGKTETSVPTKPSDGALNASLTAAPSSRPASETSAHLRPSDLLTTVSSHTATRVTSPPSHDGASGNCVNLNTALDPKTAQTILSALVAVIVFLCVLLCVLCFLVVQHRRKHLNTAVTPGNPIEEKSEQESGASRDQSPLDRSDNRDPDLVLRRTFTGVRAKSAQAVLFTVSGNKQVTEQAESEQEKQGDGHRVDSKGILVEHFTNTTEENDKQTDTNMKIQENSHCASVSADTVPYLSMNTNQIRPEPEDVNTECLGQRSQQGKVLWRIYTWPLTAAQWRHECKTKAEEFPGQEKETVKEVEHEDKEENHMEDFVNTPNQNPTWRHSHSSKLQDKTASQCDLQAHADLKQEDLTTARSTCRKKNPNQDIKPAENPPHKTKHDRREQRNEEGAENTSSGSKAPSGGATPDDDALLNGNEYVFMDLLHEVVQNRGRWTRERWRQVHANKERR